MVKNGLILHCNLINKKITGVPIMLSISKQIMEERAIMKNKRKKDLTVKVISYDEAKRLGDAICTKYKKAFDLLKDK